MTKSTPLFTGLAVCGFVSVLSSGCKQEPNCPALGACGGDVPIGTWTLTPAVVTGGQVSTPAHASCSEDLYVPVSDPRLVGGGDVPAARSAPPEPALYDWCDGLVTSSGTNIETHAAIFYAESAPVGFASVRLDASGAWTSGITRTGTFELDFPALCMREFGAMDGRVVDPTVSPATGDVCAQLQVQQRAAGKGTGSYQNTTCEDNPNDPGGCVCFFDDQETGGPSGYYQQLDSSTLLFLSDKGFPNRVTYCNEGSSLELTGKDGEYLFGVKGLRTLDLAKTIADCTDGAQGPGEEGVDCGGQCPTACPPPATP